MIERIEMWRDDAGNPHTNVPRVLIHHSPDGFEWGYNGSGPADLALNILHELVPANQVGLLSNINGVACSSIMIQLYKEFKNDFISRVPKEGGEIELVEVFKWIESKIRELQAGV
jgi:hypothetical protein